MHQLLQGDEGPSELLELVAGFWPAVRSDQVTYTKVADETGDPDSGRAQSHLAHDRLMEIDPGLAHGREKGRQRNHRCSVLVIMEDRLVERLFESPGHGEAGGCRNVFQMDRGETPFDGQYGVHNFSRFSFAEQHRDPREADHPAVDHGFPFHHRQSGLGPDRSQSQDGRSVCDDPDTIAVVGPFPDLFGIVSDGQANAGHSRGVEVTQLLERVERDLGDHLDLATTVPIEDAVRFADKPRVRQGGQPFGDSPAGFLINLDRDLPSGPVLVATDGREVIDHDTALSDCGENPAQAAWPMFGFDKQDFRDLHAWDRRVVVRGRVETTINPKSPDSRSDRSSGWVRRTAPGRARTLAMGCPYNIACDSLSISVEPGMDLQDRKFIQTFSIFLLALLVTAVLLIFLANGLAIRSRDESFGSSRLAERQAYLRLRPVGQVGLESKSVSGEGAATPMMATVQGPALKTPAEIRHFMTAQGCFACHAIDSKVVGPAYAWVAYRFRGQVAAAVVKLAHKIIKGGVGYWNPWTGGIAMPAHPQLSLAQAETLARWVLAQHPLAPPKP